MSTIIMAACWPLQGMTPTQKSVLISLADQANDEGYCWPSVNTISQRTCISERSVQAAIKWLEGVGLLRSNMRRGTSSVYQLTPAAYAPPQMPHPRSSRTPPPQMPHPTPADAAPHPRRCRTQTIIEPSLNRQGTVIDGAQAHKAKPPARAAALPGDFVPDESCERLAAELGLSLAEQQAAFEDHHSARGSVFKDWQAALRTWLRNAKRFGQRAGGRLAAKPVNKQEQLEARNREVGDAWEAQMRAQMQGGAA